MLAVLVVNSVGQDDREPVQDSTGPGRHGRVRCPGTARVEPGRSGEPFGMLGNLLSSGKMRRPSGLLWAGTSRAVIAAVRALMLCC